MATGETFESMSKELLEISDLINAGVHDASISARFHYLRGRLAGHKEAEAAKAPASPQGSPDGGPPDLSKMTTHEKGQFINKHGLAAFTKLVNDSMRGTSRR